MSERKMSTRKVGFVGIRTHRLLQMVALFRDALGVPVAREASDLVGFKLADGTVLELYAPGDAFHAFFETGPVVGFEVVNFDDARRAMIEAGIELHWRGAARRRRGLAAFPVSRRDDPRNHRAKRGRRARACLKSSHVDGLDCAIRHGVAQLKLRSVGWAESLLGS